MAKILATAAIVIMVLGGVTQLVIPGFAERRIESNLEEEGDGGEAVVDVKAFPAVRLLWGDGDRFEARGRGLTIDLAQQVDDPLGKLDGFDEVDIDFTDLTSGPVDVQSFSLVKGEDDDAYTLRMEAETTPVALAESVGGGLGGALGSMIAGSAAATLPGGGEIDVPIDMAGEIDRTSDGGIDADAVEASVAGIPAGPFAEAMVQSVLERL